LYLRPESRETKDEIIKDVLSPPRVRFAVCLLLIALLSPAATFDLSNNAVDPFASEARVRVFLFARTDCPLTHRYAPELQRLSREFGQNVQFWIVYPDATETGKTVEADFAQYSYPGKPLLDPHRDLVTRTGATIAPETVVFDSSGKLRYRGRIDDQWVDFGKARPAARVHDLENAIRAVLTGKPVPQPETRAVGCSLADAASRPAP